MDYTLAQVGSGKLGLGLIGDISVRCGLKLTILNRQSSEPRHKLLQNQKKYTIFKSESNRDVVPIDDFCLYPSNLEPNSNDPFSDRLSRKDIAIVTTATGMNNKQALSDTAVAICRGLRARMSKKMFSPLLVVACENIPNNSTTLKSEVLKMVAGMPEADEFIGYVNKNIHFADCIVDRICSDILVNDDGVTVVAEEYGQWVIDVSNITQQELPFLEILRKSDMIELVPRREDFELYQTQKLWCVNSIHLAIATYARRKDNPILSLSAAIEDPEIFRDVRAVQREFSRALYLETRRLNSSEFTPDDLNDFDDMVLERIKANATDSPERILFDLLKTTSLKGLRKAVEDINIENSPNKKDPKSALKTEDVASLLQNSAVNLAKQLSLQPFISKVGHRVLEPMEILMTNEERNLASTKFLVNIIRTLERQLEIFNSELDESIHSKS